MGGKSTSDSAVLSDKKASSSSVFDLHSWQGLTQVLKVGKDSLHNPEAYSEFRNLVLQYAQQGGDIELRKKIDAIVATFSKTSSSRELGSEQEKQTAVPTSGKPKPVPQNQVQRASSFGNRRIQPEFKKTISVAPAPVSFEPEPVIRAEVTVTLPVVEMVESKPTPTPTPEPALQQVPEPTAVREVHHETIPSAPKPSSTPVAAPEASVVQSQIKTVEEYKNRIAEIKRDVNSHVGNPVSLMGLPNDLGKKYMTALLGALKATGGGSVEGVDSAMMGLEEAYQHLVKPNAKKEESEEATTPEIVSLSQAPKPEPTLEPQPAFVPKPEPTPLPSVPEPAQDFAEVPEAEPMLEPVLSTFIHEPESEEPKEIVVPPELPQELQREVLKEEDALPTVIDVEPKVVVADPWHGEEDSETEETLDVATPEDPRVPLRSIEFPPREPKGDHSSIRTASEALSSLFHKKESDADQSPTVHLSSVVAQEAVHHMSDSSDDAPFAANKYTKKEIGSTEKRTILNETGVNSTDVAVKQSELSSPQITQSLHQLLHEWSIFSGSGLFGMGPGGSDHPLYLKLAPLSMGEILAGRWEKSDPKVNKVIKQYVDAWRHEQAVAYTINETFEHYLRRVVQRILKRQQ